jgi:glycosyltransferase involved in cell wall biosynthesis
VIELAFWSLAGIIVYVYAGYPALLWVMAKVIPNPVRRSPVTPFVSLLVAAYNEADVIEAKIRNALALEYPADRLEIVIGSDGSVDGTAEAAATLANGDRVRLVAYPENRGKLRVLNDTVPLLRGDVVAFSDASSMLAPDAMRTLVESFADPSVGGVSGVYKVRNHDAAQIGASEDLYWKYETFLKHQEAAIASILGGHGSLYAIRRSLYPFPSAGTVNDDYAIAVAVLQQGYRMVYEPRAVAYEDAHEMSGFGRRVRIMTGNVKQLSAIGDLLKAGRRMEVFFFLSHKAGRLAVPFCMIGAGVTNLMLLSHPIYRFTAAAQLCFYVLAGVGAVLTLTPKILRLPFYFTMINLAAIVGVFTALRGGRVEWKRA